VAVRLEGQELLTPSFILTFPYKSPFNNSSMNFLFSFLEKWGNALISNNDFGISSFFKGYDELKARSSFQARLVMVIYAMCICAITATLFVGSIQVYGWLIEHRIIAPK